MNNDLLEYFVPAPAILHDVNSCKPLCNKGPIPTTPTEIATKSAGLVGGVLQGAKTKLEGKSWKEAKAAGKEKYREIQNTPGDIGTKIGTLLGKGIQKMRPGYAGRFEWDEEGNLIDPRNPDKPIKNPYKTNKTK